MRKSAKITILMLVFLILSTNSLLANSLDVSFCNDIPQNINFGDSTQTIIDKMGRPPDEQRTFDDDKKSSIVFNIVPTAPFEFRLMGYLFDQDSLISIAVLIDNPIKGEEKGEKNFGLATNFHLYLESLYGSPKYYALPNAYYEDASPIKVTFWERPNNAIVITPIEKPGVQEYRIIWVLPLDPNSQYDTRKF